MKQEDIQKDYQERLKKFNEEINELLKKHQLALDVQLTYTNQAIVPQIKLLDKKEYVSTSDREKTK